MGNPWFQFKKFRIEQENSALKVGTDGVLLGAWCEVANTKQILDVGTGTGLIALMLAQRSEAKIHAVEINGEACKDALNNFQKSPWAGRLKLYHADFNYFSQNSSSKYDLVVSNPPYFEKSLRSADPASALARHDTSLSFLQLITGSKKLLTENGRLAVVLPVGTLDDFRETARLAGFYLYRKTQVIPKTGKAPKRILLEFSVSVVYPVVDELFIMQKQDKYSEKYVNLTKEFYLNFL
ncbi:MAG: methyltransferase [Bacteroidetes bacterium]|nr:methyltransferase [Bacteroidota bacterium]MCL6103799.1 methyltransferase [Bacteroidota bacterium]